MKSPRVSRYPAILACTLALFTTSQAVTITWTGTTDNAWDTANNWGGAVPTSADDATFANTVANASPTLLASTTYTVNGINVTGGSAIDITGGDSATVLRVGAGGISNNSGSGLTFSSPGTLTTATTNSTLTIGGSNNITINGAIVNNGTTSVTKTGGGTLLLNGASTFTGDFNINGGTVRTGASTSLSTAAAYVSSGTTLDLDSNNLTIKGLNGNGGSVTLGSATLTLGDPGFQSYGGVISGTGSVVKNGTSQQTLYGNNTFTGTLTINGGTLRLGNGGPGGSVAGNIVNNATLTFLRSDDYNYGGVISGSGNVIKNNTVTTNNLTLSGINTYTGNTNINAGTLTLTGSIANSALTTVANGATLTGGGSLGGLSVAGTYAPGSSPALVSVGSLTVTSTGLLQMEIGGLNRGSDYDALNISGALTAGGTLTVSFINSFVPSGPATFNLFDFSSSSGTFATVNLPSLGGAYAWDASALSTTGELSITAIPEPSTDAMLAGMVALGLALRRRRRA